MDPLQSTDVRDLVRQGIAAARSGRAAEARQLLQRVVELDPDDEMAWLWLSGLMETPAKKRECLKQVLRINPQNVFARAGLTRLSAEPLPDDAPSLEARLAAVTQPPGTSNQHPTQPSIKRPTWVRRDVASPKAPSEGEREMLCPGCDHPISPHMRVCPNCYLELKPLEELLQRNVLPPDTKPLERKPKRRGLLGLLSG